MIRPVSFALLVLSCLALVMAAFGPAIAENRIFISPNNKQESSTPDTSSAPKVFISKHGEHSPAKNGLLSKLFGGVKNKPNENTQQKANFEKDFKKQSAAADVSFNYDKFYAAYKKAESLDPALLNETGDGPQTAEELNGLRIYKQQPLMMAMLDKREKIEKYTAALMQKSEEESPKAAVQNASPQVEKTNYIFNQKNSPAKPKKVFY